MTVPPSSVAQALETLISVQRQLADAAGRLADVAARATGVAAQTDWRTHAATAFHATAEAWRRDVGTVADEVDRAAEEVGRDRARIATQASWGPL